MTDKNLEKRLELVRKHTIYEVIHGSYAYGMQTPTSDVDKKGICLIPDERLYFGSEIFEQQDGGWTDSTGAKEDKVIYSLSKFISLAKGCNPNILEILFTDESDILICTDAGREIRNNREIFISKKARHTFGGYAHSQLLRINTHKKWIDNPLVEPNIDNFKHNKEFIQGPLGTSLPAGHKILSIRKMCYSDLKLDPSLAIIYDLSDSNWHVITCEVYDKSGHEAAKENWSNYTTWKKNRNPARYKLEEVSGYDCYTADTEFLTESGWKTFDNIMNADKLATVYTGPETVKHHPFMIEYQTPTERFSGTFTGNIYNLIAYHTDVAVTPNHKMMLKRVERNTGKDYEWGFIEAAQMPDCFDIINTITPKTKNYKLPEQLKGLPIPDRVFMSLMGWYLSDGCMQLRNKKIKSLRISQKKGGKLHWQMSRFHGKWSSVARSSLYEYKRSSTLFRPYEITEVVLDIRNNYIVDRLYSDCGRKENKRIPRWVFGLSKRQMFALLRGALLGDGTKREHKTIENTWIYYSKSKGLADDIQELAFHCGFETSLYGPYKNVTHPYYPNVEMYHVHINTNAKQLRRLNRHSNVKTQSVTDQKIVCFTVPNSTLITRRNGHIGIHGNSKHAAHLVRLLRMGYEIMTLGKVIVKRPDKDELLSIRNGAWSYEKVVTYAEEMDAKIEEAEKTSKLPYSPDHEAIESLLVKLTKNALREAGVI